MRTIHLLIHQESITHLMKNNDVLCNLYGRHEANTDSKITKRKEEEDLCIFIDTLKKYNTNNIQDIYNGYFWNYTIPRIGKEFDLIRIGKQSIINVEIKSIATNEKMETQLRKNRKYLKIMQKDVHLFSFCSSDCTLYRLGDETFRKADFHELIDLLHAQIINQNIKIDDIFSPKQFLISPFNNTTRFLEDEYFLTTQQEKIDRDICKLKHHNHVILGGVGTGKSLLLYHIAKVLMQTHHKKVSMIHCGLLNEGHQKLIEHGYQIHTLDEWLHKQERDDSQILCIDETQRMKDDEMVSIMENAKVHNRYVIIAIDPLQIFDLSIKTQSPYQKYKEQYHFHEYKVSNHIRSNPSIARFCKDVMDLKKHHGRIPSDYIHIHSANSYESAKQFVTYYERRDYCLIDCLNDDGNKNVHEVIGQEFDKVISIVDEEFFYNEEGKLDHTSNDMYALKPEMFYEVITRARMHLVVIVVNNPDVFMKILKLFK